MIKILFVCHGLILPITVCDSVHNAIHADTHELVQCRFRFHPIPPSVVSHITSKPER